MINDTENPVEWALMAEELNEAHQHLEELVQEIATSGRIDERDFQVRIGHVYAHLNRVWNGRNRTDEITDDQWERMSQFPQDLIPVG